MQNSELAAAIAKLDAITKVTASQSFDIEHMQKVTEESLQLLRRLNDLAILYKQNDLQKLFMQLSQVIKALHLITQDSIDKAPQPHALMYSFADSFDRFLSKYISKRNQKNLSNIASFIPVIDSVVHLAETMPYYWQYANRQEKVAMVLSAVLITAAVAIGIAALCSPAIAATPLVMSGLWACLKIGRALFDSVIGNPEKNFQEMQKTKELNQRLEEIQDVMDKSFKKKYPESRPNILSSMPVRQEASTTSARPDTPITQQQKHEKGQAHSTQAKKIAVSNQDDLSSVKKLRKNFEKEFSPTPPPATRNQKNKVQQLAAEFEKGFSKQKNTSAQWNMARW